MPTSRRFSHSYRRLSVQRLIVALLAVAASSVGTGRLLAQAASDDPAHWTWQRHGATSQTSEDEGPAIA